jgi:poly(A) polymerase
VSHLTEQAFESLREAAPDGFLVGGCVRDWLLGRALKDLDIAVPAGVEAVGRRTADRLGGVFFWLRQEMNVARVLIRGAAPLQIDIVPLLGTLDQDLRRRDFTINAMAVSAQDGLVDGAPVIDPTGGQTDLSTRSLRLAAPDALQQDPLRSLRAFRLRAALGLTFHPSLEPALRSAGPGLSRVSGERIRDELFVLLESAHSAQVMSELLLYDLVAPWSPILSRSAAGAGSNEPVSGQPVTALIPGIGMVRELDCWLVETAPPLAIASDVRTTLEAEVTAPRTRLALTRLAALSAGAGSRSAEIARALCLSADETRVVTRAAQAAGDLFLARPEQGRERLQFYQRTEPGSVEAVLVAIAAGRAGVSRGETRMEAACRNPGLAPGEPTLIEILSDVLSRRLRPVPPLLSGEEVMAALQLSPGPLVGQYLQAVEEHRADGWLRTAEEAREWLRERRQA